MVDLCSSRLLFGAVVLCASLALTITYAGSLSGVLDFDPNGTWAVQIGIDVEAADVRITLKGPHSVWFAVGFGSTEMTETWAIVVDSDGNTQTQVLGADSLGQLSADSVRLLESTVESGIRKTLVTRRVNGSHYTFPTDFGAVIDVIFAKGLCSEVLNCGHSNSRESHATGRLLLDNSASANESNSDKMTILIVALSLAAMALCGAFVCCYNSWMQDTKRRQSLKRRVADASAVRTTTHGSVLTVASVPSESNSIVLGPVPEEVFREADASKQVEIS